MDTFRAWAATVKGDVIFPVDAGYDAARRIWNLDIDRRPALIVRCADEDDVVRAVDFARTRGLIVAVRSGGHSQAGHSVCDDGMLIDLAVLSDADVDPEARTVRIGAGMRVGALLEATGAFGLATPTGTCPDVGVAGLTLGGGENLLMAQHGAVCDNVISARVVTADGRIVTASADDNADLYWAIRGGGGNFGIVTALSFSLHPLTRVLSGRLIFPVSRAREVMKRYRDLMSHAPDTLQTSGGLAFSEDEPTLFIALCHCGDTEPANALIQRWREGLRPGSDTIEWMPYSADFTLPAIASNGNGSFLPELGDEVIDVLAEYFTSAPPLCTAAWNDYHGAVTRVRPDAMAFPLRQSGYDVFVHAAWNTPQARTNALTWLRDLHSALRPWQRALYVNNIGTESAEQTAAAYGANFERLTMIKAKYDPDNFFRLNHNILPAEK